MVTRDGAEVRRERLEKVARIIQAALFKVKGSGEIPLSETVADLMLKTGLTEPKITEYLNLLMKAGQFEMDLQNDKIKRVCV